MNFGFSKKKTVIILGLWVLWILLLNLFSMMTVSAVCDCAFPTDPLYDPVQCMDFQDFVVYKVEDITGCHCSCTSFGEMLIINSLFGLLPLIVIFLIYSLVEKNTQHL